MRQRLALVACALTFGGSMAGLALAAGPVGDPVAPGAPGAVVVAGGQAERPPARAAAPRDCPDPAGGDVAAAAAPKA